MPKISVLIPAYNSEKTINKCIDSIMEQTYLDYEIVVVDDGSSDNTFGICKRYTEKYDNIHLIHTDNKGVAAARNCLIHYAKGDFFLFVDSDDWISRDMLQVMYDTYTENINAEIIACGFEILPNGKRVTINANTRCVELTNHALIYEFLCGKTINGMLWNKLIKRELFDGLEFDENVRYGEDVKILWEMIKKCKLFIGIPDVLYHQVIQPQGLSKNKYSHSKFGIIYVWESIVSDVIKSYNSLAYLAKARLGAVATYNLYCMKNDKYCNTKDLTHAKKIVKSNIKYIIKDHNVSVKTKTYALKTFLF